MGNTEETLATEARQRGGAAEINEAQLGRHIRQDGKVGKFEKVIPHLVIDLLQQVEEEKPEEQRMREPLFWAGVEFYRMRRAFTQPVTGMAMGTGDGGKGVMEGDDGVRLADKFLQVTARLTWMEQRILGWVCGLMPESSEPEGIIRKERQKLYMMRVSVECALERLDSVIGERVKAGWK